MPTRARRLAHCRMESLECRRQLAARTSHSPSTVVRQVPLRKAVSDRPTCGPYPGRGWHCWHYAAAPSSADESSLDSEALQAALSDARSLRIAEFGIHAQPAVRSGHKMCTVSLSKQFTITVLYSLYIFFSDSNKENCVSLPILHTRSQIRPWNDS